MKRIALALLIVIGCVYAVYAGNSAITGLGEVSLSSTNTWTGMNTFGGLLLGDSSPDAAGEFGYDGALKYYNTASRTVVSLDETQTLTNKTLTAPYQTSPEVDCHADGNLTAAQVSTTVVTNYDQADGNATCILAPAAQGYSALFTVATARAKTYGVRAKATDKIYLLAADGTISAGADHGAVVMVNAQVGQQFACYTFKTGATDYDWACKAIAIGTSTFEARPAP